MRGRPRTRTDLGQHLTAVDRHVAAALNQRRKDLGIKIKEEDEKAASKVVPPDHPDFDEVSKFAAYLRELEKMK